MPYWHKKRALIVSELPANILSGDRFVQMPPAQAKNDKSSVYFFGGKTMKNAVLSRTGRYIRFIVL